MFPVCFVTHVPGPHQLPKPNGKLCGKPQTANRASLASRAKREHLGRAEPRVFISP